MIIRDLITEQLAHAIALKAPGQRPLSYGELAALTDETSRNLAARGFTPRDKLAIVLPNGPEMAAAFIAMSNSCATAPLNPAHKEEEFAYYLDDLKARALIIDEAGPEQAVATALRLGIETIHLKWSPDVPAGRFSLSGGMAAVRPALADDTALVLHTSGTTSRPKIVPLTHANLIACPTELDALLGSVIELGRMTGVVTPTLELIYDLTKALPHFCGSSALTTTARRAFNAART
jgi:oxalate---CoA ligase